MMIDVESARRQMIEQQVRACEVLDLRVLDALLDVPREEFAPVSYGPIAFADTQVPIGHGQAMLTPSLEGRILQALVIKPTDRILEVGTGSGFFAAVLGRLGRSVRSIDVYPDFIAVADNNLRRLGIRNVEVAVADAMHLTEEGAYDVIALTGSLPVHDARFERALTIGGRLFVAVGAGPAMEAQRITRAGHGEFVRDSLFEVSIAPLIHAQETPKFVF